MNYTIPMGIWSIASHLESKGVDVRILDQRRSPDTFYDELRVLLRDCRFVGLSVMTSQVKQALEISTFVREFNPDIHIVWGGFHPTLYPKQTLASPLVDFVVRGEGEYLMQRLIECNDFSSLNRSLSDDENVDLNELPFPSLDVVSPTTYLIKTIHSIDKRTMEINSSRGCPHRCSFCVNTIVSANRWRFKSANRVVDEIEYFKKHLYIEHIHFLDENFFVDRQRSRDIVRGIIDRKLDITWQTNVRCDYFTRGFLGGDFIKDVKKSGCIQLNFGGESGSNEILRMIKKDANVKQLVNAVTVCSENGIVANCSFIIGLPNESKEDMKKTVALIKKLKEIDEKTIIIGPQIFRPYPGCELFQECSKMGFKEPSSLEEWAEMDEYLNTGYVSTDKLAWIKDKSFVEAISLYMPFATQNLSKQKSLMVNMFILISKTRLLLGFWAFPYEYKVLQKIRRT
jgi:radical SAM superfamily enzyme YgiQ (UPF0313 family)